MSRRLILVIILVVAFGSGVIVLSRNKDKSASTHTGKQTVQEETNSAGQEEVVSEVLPFNKSQYSLDQPGSLWLVVNKTRPLPDTYKPIDLSVPNVKLRLAASQEQMQLSGVAIPQLEVMFAAAQKEGVNLVFGSGFRSYALQKQFYDGYVARDGQLAADRYSARPGTSEHQTGLSFDITAASGACHLEICFKDQPEGVWAATHAHEYGFTIRYRDGKEGITGYQYEPWHLRYVGKELAAELHKNNQTMEEFFGL